MAHDRRLTSPRAIDVFNCVTDPELLELLRESDGVYFSTHCKHYDNTGRLAA